MQGRRPITVRGGGVAPWLVEPYGVRLPLKDHAATVVPTGRYYVLGTNGRTRLLIWGNGLIHI